MKNSQRRFELNRAPTLEENNIVNSLIFAMCMSVVTRVGDRGVLALLSSNHAPFTQLGQCLSEETLEVVGPFYIVSYRAG